MSCKLQAASYSVRTSPLPLTPVPFIKNVITHKKPGLFNMNLYCEPVSCVLCVCAVCVYCVCVCKYVFVCLYLRGCLVVPARMALVVMGHLQRRAE